MVYLTRVEHFNAAHKLYNPDWSREQNDAVFGKCANDNWHGHNYELMVTVKGLPNPETGFVMDMKLLSDLVKKEIHSRFDHKNLNLDVAEFRKLNPTAENIAVVIYDLLRPHIKPSLELFIRLFETPRNFVEYPA